MRGGQAHRERNYNRMPLEEKYHNKQLFKRMLSLWLILVTGFGGAMLWAALKTQVKEGEMWREKAQRREYEERVEPARRGTIFSSDGKVLATTMPVCDLVLDLGRWPKVDSKGKTVRDDAGRTVMEGTVTNDSAFRANLPEVCRLLHSQFPNRSEAEFRSRIMNEYTKARPGRCIYVARKVLYSHWDRIRKMEGWSRCVCSGTAEGSVTSYVRAHIYGNLGENTIGIHYRTVKSEGYTGLEGYYDSVLRGRDGRFVCRRLTRGVWLPMEEGDSLHIQRREDGKSIVATIDTRFQDIAESALRQSMQQNGGQRGCAILMEAATGYVLACSSLTRDTAGRISEALWSNVACSDLYEPGSTFKTVLMTAMLEDKKIGIDTSLRVRSGGEKQYSPSTGVLNDGHEGPADTVSLPTVLARSSNIGMCELAWRYYRNDRARMKRNVEAVFPFGMMRPDLEVKEYKAYVSDLGPDRNFLNFSYGYSCAVSPLRLVTFYNALANGGKMVKPLFCREVIDGGGRSQIGPVVLREHICSEETAKQMREMLLGVVERGTGSNIYNTVYGIAGKTGTSQSIRDKHINTSSFAGFFPADAPRYTCLVMVEGTGSAGRVAAAPVFRKIADCVVAFDKELGSVRIDDSARVQNPRAAKAPRTEVENISRLLGIPFAVSDTTPATQWTVFDEGSQCYKNYHLPKGVVPNCVGMTVRDAMELLRRCGMKARFSGMGKVASQSPKSHTRAAKGTVVYLELKP